MSILGRMVIRDKSSWVRSIFRLLGSWFPDRLGGSIKTNNWKFKGIFLSLVVTRIILKRDPKIESIHPWREKGWQSFLAVFVRGQVLQRFDERHLLGEEQLWLQLRVQQLEGVQHGFVIDVCLRLNQLKRTSMSHIKTTSIFKSFLL